MKTTFQRIIPITLLCVITIFSACNKKDDDPATPSKPSSSNAPADAPQQLLGKRANMEFTFEVSGAPYVLNQLVNFTFATNGNLGVDQDPSANNGDELTLPFDRKQNNEYFWTDNTNGYVYVLSLINDTTINEINVFDLANTFLGQFTPVDNGQGSNLVAQYEGIYNVTAVLKGSHTRMDLSIDAAGNIDFDTGIQLDESNFALVSDRLECCDGIWIDMDPYPTEDYQRVELYIDSISGDLNAIHYYPSYPNISGRVYVELSK